MTAIDAKYIESLQLRHHSAQHLPTGKVLFRQDLLPYIEKMAAALRELSAIEDAHLCKDARKTLANSLKRGFEPLSTQTH